MEEKYCMFCKSDLKKVIKEETYLKCKSCGKIYYPSSDFCIICLIEYEHKFLILKQNHINNHFSLVSGYVKKNETLEECVYREVYEETKLEIVKIDYIKSYTYIKANCIMCGFYVKVKNDKVIPNYEINSYVWKTFQEAKSLLKATSVAKKLLEDYTNK